MIDVSIILVGMNAKRYIRECVESIEAAASPSTVCEIVYVDNGSVDGSVEMVRERFPRVRVIANPTNLGYSRACNQGAEIAAGRHLFFLNDDTLIIGDAIGALARLLDGDRSVGVVGARLLNTDLTDQWSGRRFPTLANAIFARRSALTRWFPDAPGLRDYLCKAEVARGEPFDVDWVSSAAMLVRRDDYFAFGRFAEDYYYWHEALFCDRFLRAGQRVVLHAGAKIVHHEGKGSGPRPYAVQRWHILNFHRGAYRFYVEHRGLAPFDPRRWLAAVGLAARAGFQLLAKRLTSHA